MSPLGHIADVGLSAGTFLNLQGVAATRPGGDLLGPVDLSLRGETITGLAGPTGAGREDLVDVLCGSLPLRSGRITLDGLDISIQSATGRVAAGIVRCRLDTPPRMDVSLRQWLLMARQLVDERAWQLLLKQPQTSHEASRKDLSAVIEMIGLNGAETEPLAQLDREQRRLAELGRALMQRPRLLILEYTFLGLDAERVTFWCRLLEKLRDEGLSLLVVDDRIAVLAELCSRIAVVARGHIIAQGQPSQVGGDPAAIEVFSGRPVHP